MLVLNFLSNVLLFILFKPFCYCYSHYNVYMYVLCSRDVCVVFTAKTMHAVY